MKNSAKKLVKMGLIIGLAGLSACSSSASNVLNPFYEEPTAEALMGAPNDHALNGSQENTTSARAALEAMASYQRANAPQPVNPVMQPSVVRLMWVPDHLNKGGDLVPAHYYYLRVLNDRWNVTDAFEIEEQLNKGSTGENSATPYVIK